MKIAKILFFILVIISFVVPVAKSSALTLANYDTGFYSIQIPAGWNVYNAGQCTELAFLVRDKLNPLNQIFYFGSVGPVYMSQHQKQIDLNYMNMGGYPIGWIEMPVIDPLTPENFMIHFTDIVSTRIAQQFMPQAPRLTNFKVISVAPQPSMIQGGKTDLIRALFTENGRVGEGLFLCTVVPFMPFNGGPGSGNAYAFMFSGATAEKSQFARILPFLTRSLGSFQIRPVYVNQCIQSSRQAFQQVMKAGDTLRETSDMIMKSWEERNKTYDILAEKRSDAMLGYERVYDPDTNETYKVEPEFWENYKLNHERYRMNNLQLVPGNNYELWNRGARDQREIR